MNQLRQLAEPFKDRLVKQAPQGKYGSYVAHSTVTERLLSIVGPYNQRVTQILYDADGIIEGCVLEIETVVDGRAVVVQEAGDCERPDNWKTNGARLKDAVSDAVKRCAMRLGLGLHLWSQQDYFLAAQLDKNAEAEPPPKREPRVRTKAQADAERARDIIGEAVFDEVSTGGGEPSAAREDADQDTPTQRGLLDD